MAAAARAEALEDRLLRMQDENLALKKEVSALQEVVRM